MKTVLPDARLTISHRAAPRRLRAAHRNRTCVPESTPGDCDPDALDGAPKPCPRRRARIAGNASCSWHAGRRKRGTAAQARCRSHVAEAQPRAMRPRATPPPRHVPPPTVGSPASGSSTPYAGDSSNRERAVTSQKFTPASTAARVVDTRTDLARPAVASMPSPVVIPLDRYASRQILELGVAIPPPGSRGRTPVLPLDLTLLLTGRRRSGRPCPLGNDSALGDASTGVLGAFMRARFLLRPPWFGESRRSPCVDRRLLVSASAVGE